MRHKWTYEECKEEVSKYKSLIELNKNCSACYVAIKANKWYGILDSIERGKMPNGYWTYEKCLTEASKYKSRGEFKKSSPSAYKASKNNKWIDIIEQFDLKINKSGYWTYENCKNEALKYNFKKDLKKHNSACYSIINRNKWFELTSHMKVIGNLKKRLIYVYEFPDNSCYVGLTGNIFTRDKEHREGKKKSSVYNYIIKSGLTPKLITKTDYISVDEASKLEGVILDSYKNNGWKILNKAKTGGVGGGNKKWSYEKCVEEIKKYNSITKLIDNSSGAYMSIRRNNWTYLLENLRLNKKEAHNL